MAQKLTIKTPDFKKVWADIQAWFKGLPKWFQQLPDKMNKLVYKFMTLPIDKKIAWVAIFIGVILVIISIVLFLI